MFQEYAKIYDLIYQDKDYGSECDFIEKLFEKYSDSAPKKILDLAAGTGSHSLIMAERGYHVTAIDYSEAMASLAKEKAIERNLTLEISGGISMSELPEPAQNYDAVLSLFSAVDYLSSPHQFDQFLKKVKPYIAPKGVLIFDFWNGNTVLKDFSPTKFKDIPIENGRILRISETELNPLENLATVNFQCLVHSNGKLVNEIKETHSMRYFFPLEVKEALERNGYDILTMIPFMGMDQAVTTEDWNITVVARGEN